MLTLLTFLVLFVPSARAQSLPGEPLIVEGQTMGTTYRVVYYDEPRRRDFKDDIDSLLSEVNKSISTYDPDAEISRFNRSEEGVSLRLPFLYDILITARRIHNQSGGAFDPTVMPLVNAWGFGPAKSLEPTPADIDSIRQFIGFEHIRFNRKSVSKTDGRAQLDMGGIGQGYGADIICKFLVSKGIEDMLIELGGEGVALGKNLQKNQPWRIGILDPNSTPDDQFFKAYITLKDKAFTTSGNYFNYRIVDGRKFGHTIDPETGYPVQRSLLSASVFARHCTVADAWATAFMVMGVEKAIDRAKRLRGIDVLFIYSTEEGGLATYVSPGLEENIILE